MKLKMWLPSIALACLLACGQNQSGGVSPAPTTTTATTTETEGTTTVTTETTGSTVTSPPETTSTAPETTTLPPATSSAAIPPPNPTPPVCVWTAEPFSAANGYWGPEGCKMPAEAAPTPVAPPPAPPTTAVAAPSPISQAAIDAVTKYPSRVDGRPDGPPNNTSGQPCHNAQGFPIACPFNRITPYGYGLYAIPATAGGYAIVGSRWLTHGFPGVNPASIGFSSGCGSVDHGIVWGPCGAPPLAQGVAISDPKFPLAACPAFRTQMAKTTGSLERMAFVIGADTAVMWIVTNPNQAKYSFLTYGPFAAVPFAAFVGGSSPTTDPLESVTVTKNTGTVLTLTRPSPKPHPAYATFWGVGYTPAVCR